jgi:exonuclease III
VFDAGPTMVCVLCFSQMVNQVGLRSDLNLRVNLNILTDALYNNSLSDIIKELPVHSYYAFEDEVLNILKNLKYDSLSCMSLNIQSLPSKNHEFGNLLNALNSNKSKISCIGLQETWLTHINNNSFSYPGYKSFFKSRQPGNIRGGVGLLIDDNFTCQPLTNEFYIDNIIETIAVRIKLGSFRATVVSLYRPPSKPGEDVNTSFETFMNFFDDFLNYLENLNEPVCILGDFNINLLNLNDVASHSSTVNESLLYAGFLQVISRATRVRPPSFSLIDYVCLRDLLPNLTHSLIIDTDISDHYPVLCILKLKNTKTIPKPITTSKRIFSATNINNFKTALSQLDWVNVTSISDTNLASINFLKILADNLNTCLPLRNFRVNRKVNPLNPWMSAELLVVRADKDRLFNIAKKRNASFQSIAEYKRYRNYYFHMINIAKKDYFKRKMIEAGRDGRKVWECFREAMGMDSARGNIDSIIVDNIEITVNEEMANHFNSYIGNLGPSLTPDLPSTLKDFRDYLPPPFTDHFIFTPLTPHILRD